MRAEMDVRRLKEHEEESKITRKEKYKTIKKPEVKQEYKILRLEYKKITS